MWNEGSEETISHAAHHRKPLFYATRFLRAVWRVLLLVPIFHASYAQVPPIYGEQQFPLVSYLLRQSEQAFVGVPAFSESQCSCLLPHHDLAVFRISDGICQGCVSSRFAVQFWGETLSVDQAERVEVRGVELLEISKHFWR